ncbi:hypothetical protein ACE1SV_74120 [Streptomyces sennicomposti]
MNAQGTESQTGVNWAAPTDGRRNGFVPRARGPRSPITRRLATLTPVLSRGEALPPSREKGAERRDDAVGSA